MEFDSQNDAAATVLPKLFRQLGVLMRSVDTFCNPTSTSEFPCGTGWLVGLGLISIRASWLTSKRAFGMME